MSSGIAIGVRGVRTTSDLDAARFKLELAHRAIGLMFAADGAAEFHDAIREFLSVTRSVWMLVAQTGYEESTRRGRTTTVGETLQRQRFDVWFKATSPKLVDDWLRADREISKRRLCTRPSAVRGVAIGRIGARAPSKRDDRERPEDFYFAFDMSRPAMAVCIEYLDRVTAFYADACEEAERLGLNR